MRVNKKGETTYYSFEELAAAYNLKPVSRVTKDKEKLASQQKKFLGFHKCKTCGEPMTYIGGNIMCCINPECRGIKHTKENEDGTKGVYYTPSFHILEDNSAEIAGIIFSETV